MRAGMLAELPRPELKNAITVGKHGHQRSRAGVSIDPRSGGRQRPHTAAGSDTTNTKPGSGRVLQPPIKFPTGTNWKVRATMTA
jgi:hypothetical protein